MNDYPVNWDKISYHLKEKHKWKCERCHRPSNVSPGYCLTIHPLDGNKANCEEWNLAVLCRRCHLQIQSEVIMSQMLFDFLDVSAWFKPHLRGYKKWLKRSK